MKEILIISGPTCEINVENRNWIFEVPSLRDDTGFSNHHSLLGPLYFEVFLTEYLVVLSASLILVPFVKVVTGEALRLASIGIRRCCYTHGVVCFSFISDNWPKTGSVQQIICQ